MRLAPFIREKRATNSRALGNLRANAGPRFRRYESANAVQYGFKDLPIGVTIKGDPEAVLVSVHNDGVPIRPEAMGGIFDSLTRGGGEKSPDDRESMNLGLGLYIKKQIVLAHGGAVGATSSEKGGTSFTATFPR